MTAHIKITGMGEVEVNKPQPVRLNRTQLVNLIAELTSVIEVGTVSPTKTITTNCRTEELTCGWRRHKVEWCVRGKSLGTEDDTLTHIQSAIQRLWRQGSRMVSAPVFQTSEFELHTGTAKGMQFGVSEYPHRAARRETGSTFVVGEDAGCTSPYCQSTEHLRLTVTCDLNKRKSNINAVKYNLTLVLFENVEDVQQKMLPTRLVGVEELADSCVMTGAGFVERYGRGDHEIALVLEAGWSHNKTKEKSHDDHQTQTVFKNVPRCTDWLTATQRNCWGT